MAIWLTDITDKAGAPSQDPADIVADADTDTGVSGSQQSGVAGQPEAEIGGSNLMPWLGFAGAYSQVDDATFVPTSNDVGAASQFVPGQRFSDGFQNEAHAREGVIVEANLNPIQRPDGAGAYITERPT